MILDKNELQAGLYIKHKFSSGVTYKKIIEVNENYVFTEAGVMPINFYLNKHNFELVGELVYLLNC